MAVRQRKHHHNHPAPFDTLQYAKKLRAVGFTQEQAEVQAETFFTVVQDQLVSKQDIKALENEIKRDIKELEGKTQTQIELLRRDLKIWFGGMLVVAVGVLAAIITLVPHLSK